jgi:hypothetical protein
MGVCNSIDKDDHNLSHNVINIVTSSRNPPEAWFVNGQKINGPVRTRKDGKLYVCYRNGFEELLKTNKPTKCRTANDSFDDYYLGYIQNENQIKLFVTLKERDVSITNDSKYDLKVEYYEKRVTRCGNGLQCSYHKKETYLLKQTFGKYPSKKLRIYTLAGNEIKFMEKKKEGYFFIQYDQIIDGLKISFDKTTEKFTITDQ